MDISLSRESAMRAIQRDEEARRAYSRFHARHPDWAGSRYDKPKPGDRCPNCGSDHTWQKRTFKVQQKRACDTCGDTYLAPKGA